MKLCLKLYCDNYHEEILFQSCTVLRYVKNNCLQLDSKSLNKHQLTKPCLTGFLSSLSWIVTLPVMALSGIPEVSHTT